jgi:prolyl-tRNA synthetase
MHAGLCAVVRRLVPSRLQAALLARPPAAPLSSAAAAAPPPSQQKKTGKKLKRRRSQDLADIGTDFGQWYLDVLREAELAEHGPVRGTVVLRPYGFAIWELLQAELDGRMKANGVQNLYLPSLLPMSFITKEADHVEGFAPELATVTHAGGKELSESLAIRPTSETSINWCLERWISSYRDLPLRLNQWVNVVRWEKRPRLLLRNSEFLWHEGHTAHATADEAEAEALANIHMYTDVARKVCALGVITGVKSPRETFAGASHSYTIEAHMGDGRALQAGTSHNLGQNFARAFGVNFTDASGTEMPVHQTSFGVSTRMVGAVVMAHGDAQGLRLPPALAPIQVVIVPIPVKPKAGEESAAADASANVTAAAESLHSALTAAGVRSKVDSDPHQSPGWKFNHWEMKGVPLRIDIGARDLAQGHAPLSRRDGRPKESVALAGPDAVSTVQSTLEAIASTMLADAEARMMGAIVDVASHEQLLELWGGSSSSTSEGHRWARVWWDGDAQDEEALQEATGATLRCIPLDEGACDTSSTARCEPIPQFITVCTVCCTQLASAFHLPMRVAGATGGSA